MSDIERSGEEGRVVMGGWLLLGPSVCGHGVRGVMARGAGGLAVCRRRFLLRGKVAVADGVEGVYSRVGLCRFCSAVNEGAGTSGGGGVSIGCGRSG